VTGAARVTLDPSERHGFEYQSWFGFTLYAENVAGALGRGGTYRILGQDEPATGFSLYPDRLIETLSGGATAGNVLFLPLGHDSEIAARLRAIGWRTRAALSENDDPGALGCTHRLEGGEAVAL
jgi:ATP phosphoribosyltransferase regulatory subunit